MFLLLLARLRALRYGVGLYGDSFQFIFSRLFELTPFIFNLGTSLVAWIKIEIQHRDVFAIHFLNDNALKPLRGVYDRDEML